MTWERSAIADLFSVAQKAGPYGELPATPLWCGLSEPGAPRLERAPLPGHAGRLRVRAGRDAAPIRAERSMVQLRYKALDSGREVVSWYCPECNTELWRREFDATSEIPQRVYLEATAEFNGNDDLRRCAKCRAVHPAVDVSGAQWGEIATWLDAERADTPPRATNSDRLPPANDREPLRTNVFELMRSTTTQLLPLFPYLGPGAMLPAGALFRGRPGAEYGRFFHRNSEEEVSVCFGGQNALGAAGVM